MKKVFAASVLGCIAPGLFAQSAPFGPQQVMTTTADEALSVFAADLDGDGDQDVLSASVGDDKIAWYENLGGGTFGGHHVITLNAVGASCVYATDIDGDGDQDVLSASNGNDMIAWYENTDGLGTFGTQQVISQLTGGARCVYAEDIDGDGDPDILAATTGSDKIAWYENTDGLGTFSTEQVITTAADTARSVYATDLDNDGDQDVLSASAGDDKIAWYENLGGNAFGSQQVITTAADAASSVFAADLDGDGDQDVLSASVGDDKIAWYENLGGNAFGTQQVITAAADGAISVFAADLDRDGDHDVLSASIIDDTIAWYENLGGGAFGSQQVITTAADFAASVFAADLDGDGDPDVLSASSEDDKIASYKNIMSQGDPTAPLAWANVWTSPPSSQPSSLTIRPGHSAIWDSNLQRIHGVGEISTWTWDGTILSTLGPTTNAVGTSSALGCMAFHEATASLIWFGGGFNPIRDWTWSLQNGQWSNPFLGIRPGGRVQASLIYDSTRQISVMYGGGTSTGSLADTWIWDGAQWSKACSPTTPPARTGHAMAFDENRSVVVMFGGSTSTTGTLSNVTWEFDGQDWQQAATATTPSPRRDHRLVYDPAEKRIIMAGGIDGTGTALDEVWSYNGSTWFPLPNLGTGPNQTSNGSSAIESLTYDHNRQVIVATCRLGSGSGLAGILDVWELSPAGTPAASTPYGTACGNPNLTLSSVDRPIIGQNAVVELTNAPTPIVGMNLGTSNTFSFPVALPFELTQAGMPGCYMNASTEAFGLPAAQTGPSTWQFSQPIPLQPALIGQHFYVQGFAYAPGANALEVITSNGIDWEIGDV